MMGPGMAKVPSITQTFYIASPPARVYSALSSPRQLTKWFLEKATIAPRVDSAFEFTWQGGYTMKGRVRDAVPRRRLELDWIDVFEGGKKFQTSVRFVLRRKGRGTLVTMTHRGFKSGRKWIALYGAINSGWAYYLANLKSVLEHGNDLRSRYDSIAG